MDLINGYKYLVGGNAEGARLLSAVSSERARDKIKHPWNSTYTWENTSAVRGIKQWDRLLKTVVESPVVGTFSQTWCWETCSSWSCLSRGLGQDDLETSLLKQMTLWFCKMWIISTVGTSAVIHHSFCQLSESEHTSLVWAGSHWSLQRCV